MATNRSLKTVTKPTVDAQVRDDVAALRVLVTTQQEQIDGLQQGYLEVVKVLAATTKEITRLQRHNGIGGGQILLPQNIRDWRTPPEGK